MKLYTCPNCKNLCIEAKSKKVLLDDKETRICKDCFDVFLEKVNYKENIKNGNFKNINF